VLKGTSNFQNSKQIKFILAAQILRLNDIETFISSSKTHTFQMFHQPTRQTHSLGFCVAKRELLSIAVGRDENKALVTKKQARISTMDAHVTPRQKFICKEDEPSTLRASLEIEIDNNFKALSV
jgi:hypothetical protein